MSLTPKVGVTCPAVLLQLVREVEAEDIAVPGERPVVVGDAHRHDAVLGVVAAGDPDVLLRKWSVPVLAELGEERRFSELRAGLPGVTPRALALALQDLEAAGYLRREVRATRPPSTVYRPTARGRRVRAALTS